MTRDTSWMEAAACKGTDPEAFFPDKNVAMPKLVRKICSSCPAQEECLEYSLSFVPILEGVWGGLGTRERGRIRTRRRSYAA